MTILEIISIIFSVFVLIRLFIVSKGRFYSLIPLVVVFDLVMVLPIGLELFLGIPDSPYRNFTIALTDQQTTMWFIIFLFVSQVAFFCETKRIEKRANISNKQTFKETFATIASTKYSVLTIFACYIVFGITILKILVAPDPSYYLQINSVRLILSPEISKYQQGMRTWINLLAVALILIKILDTNKKIGFLLTRIIFLITIVFVDQKRTLLMIVVGICFLIDYLNDHNTKKLIIKYIVVGGFVIGYFIAYAYLSEKVSYNDDWYYEFNEYFFRSMHLRFAIYAALHPSEIHILDYPGQSILFSVFYFVPRTLWHSKPWPYVYYYISGVLGYSALSYSKIGWGMPASYYTEFVSNFGIVGLFIGIVFTVWAARFFDRRDFMCKFLGTSLIAMLEIYYYDNVMKILAFIVLILYLRESIVAEQGFHHIYFRIRKD